MKVVTYALPLRVIRTICVLLCAATAMIQQGCSLRLNTPEFPSISMSRSLGLASAVYRSVGPGNTAALAVGTANSLTVTDSVATFSAPLPANVGVGDVIQYDSNQSGAVNAIAFISGRTDANHFLVQNLAGAIPVSTTQPDQRWSIFRAYTSLFNAVQGIENSGIAAGLRNFDTWTGGANLPASGQSWNIACYADAPDNDTSPSGVDLSGWTTDSARYLKIYTPVLPTEVGTSQRHSGVFTTAAYHLVRADASGVENLLIGPNSAGIRIEGLQLWNNWAGTPANGISITLSASSDLRLSHNILRGGGTGQSHAIQVGGALTGDPKLRIWNNLTYGFGGYGYGDFEVGAAGRAYLYNNTFICSDNTQSYLLYSTSRNVTTRNNILQGLAPAGVCLGVAAYNGDNDYNVCSTINDGDNGIHSKWNAAVSFVNAAANDYHLAVGDTAARASGTSLSADAIIPFGNTLDLTIRTDPWNAGAL